jgi:hypothetical protein
VQPTVAVILDENAARRVCGLRMAERAILTLGRAGAGKVILVGTPPAGLRTDGVAVEIGAADGAHLTTTTSEVFDLGFARRALAQGGDTRQMAFEGCFHEPLGPGSQRALLRSLRRAGDGTVSRLINRHVSLAITRFLMLTPVTPNQMTIVTTAVGALGVWLVLAGHVAWGAFLVNFSSILDGCDGEIARLKLQMSRVGEWLDNVLDDGVNAGFGLALAFAAHVPWLGLAATGAILFYDVTVYVQLATVHGGTGNPAAFRWWFQPADVDVATHVKSGDRDLMRVVHSVARRDVYLFIWTLLAIAGLPIIAAVWYAVMAAGYFALTAVHLGHVGAHRRA